ncbi:MAG: biopolymer transporter ExbD [Cytophagaceae bacterium]|nr:biopolymer transporter ExbD [Cytophagaceae bacterium]
MAQVKAKRHGVSLDMTAMCDVAFLLLTFFILTAKLRPDEAVQVTPPTSIAQTPIKDSEIITVTVAADGRIFVGADAQPVRVGMLDRIGAKYNITFTAAEREQFKLMENFGTPIANVKQLLNLEPAERKAEGVQTGIPCDSVRNELGDWVLYARMLNPKQRIVIKADSEAEYKVVKNIIDALQTQNINNFNLITGQESRPVGSAKKK